jgi:NADPH:quinone reductase-like Zn-dependent oxidoreductase
MSSINRKVYRINPGSMKSLKITEELIDGPGAGEVRVQIKAIGLNFADVFSVWKLYSAIPKGAFIPGLEYAGVVESVGEGVTNFKPGDRVMGICRFGAYSSYLNIDKRYLVSLPEDWTFSEGAAYLVQSLTAYYALLDLGGLKENMNVLIHSAAGGVGTYANRIAKKHGAYTIGTVGRESKVAYCKNEGYDEVIVRDNKNFGEQLKGVMKDKPLNLILECIGGPVLKDGYTALAEQGRMVVYGSAYYASDRDKPRFIDLLLKYKRRPMIDPQQMIQLNKGVLGFNLIYLYERVELMHSLLGELAKLDLDKPTVGEEFTFENLADALRLFRTGKTIGKVVVTV